MAIPVSPETRQQVEVIKREFPELRVNVRLVHPENLHLTLKFLGDTDEKIVPAISKTITEIASKIRRFEYVCEGVGCFPNNRNPRILWLGVTRGFDEIKELSGQIEAGLQTFGYLPERRGFQPHLTIGRIKNPQRKIDDLENFLKYEFISTINRVENVIFYESNLTAGGAIYTRLAVFNLK